MKINLVCLYCGHEWNAYFIAKEAIEKAECLICNDTSLKVRDANTAKVNYYAGAPDFPTVPESRSKQEQDEDLEQLFGLWSKV